MSNDFRLSSASALHFAAQRQAEVYVVENDRSESRTVLPSGHLTHCTVERRHL
jgi:hypothetical protein